MVESHFTFPHPDGAQLAARRWSPAGAPRGVVQILHGMAEHCARYERFALALTNAGFVVYTHDAYGHGASVVRGHAAGHMGDEDSFHKAVVAAHSLSQRAAAEHPGLPFVLFAHSMGSFHAQSLIATHPEPWDAVVLSATNGPPSPLAILGRVVARAERRRIGRAQVSNLIHNMAFGGFNKPFEPARTPYDWLSRDAAEVDKYIQDPLCGFPCSVQTWVDLLDALKPLTASQNVGKIRKELPILLIAGTRDAVGDMGEGVKRLQGIYQSAGLKRVTMKLYPEARHELLNETNRDEVTRDVLGWIDGAIKR